MRSSVGKSKYRPDTKEIESCCLTNCLLKGEFWLNHWRGWSERDEGLYLSWYLFFPCLRGDHFLNHCLSSPKYNMVTVAHGACSWNWSV